MESMFNSFPQAPCPNCNKPRRFMERYPNALCPACHKGPIVDANGSRVTFINTHPLGYGVASEHHENGKIVVKDEPFCFLEGKTCYAQEYRFGGIVIQMITDCPFCRKKDFICFLKGVKCYENDTDSPRSSTSET